MTAFLRPSVPPALPLLTAEEFVQRYPNHRVELVDGVVKELEMPGFRHGKVCVRFSGFLFVYFQANDIGHLVSHDTSIKVRSDPDLVFGPDLAYFSYGRLAKGVEPQGMPGVLPELVAEVRSPSDMWTVVFAKVEEYFAAGVNVVLVLDPETRTVLVCRPGPTQETLKAGDTLTIPDVLPGFAVPVAVLFE